MSSTTYRAARWWLRLGQWWRRYAGSAAWLALLLITAFGFWQLEASINRIDAAEVDIAVERELNLATLKETQRFQQLLIEQNEQLERVRLRAIRRANVESCTRQNVLIRRLRMYVQAQLQFAQAITPRTLPDEPLPEVIRIRAAQLDALRRLHQDLEPVDCEAAYPPAEPVGVQ